MKTKDQSFTVPKKVRENAKQGLELRREHGRGGLSTQEAGEQGIGSGVARARDLIEGSVSYETVKRMLAFFRRHSAFKEYHKDKTSAAWISWMIWGGDAGFRWARDIVREVEGIKKGSLLEAMKLGEEPEWEENYEDEDLDDTLDAPEEEEQIKKGTFIDMLSAIRRDYSEPVIAEPEPTPTPKVETPIFNFSEAVKRLKSKIDILEDIVTPIEEANTPLPVVVEAETKEEVHQEEAPNSPLLAEEADPPQAGEADQETQSEEPVVAEGLSINPNKEETTTQEEVIDSPVSESQDNEAAPEAALEPLQETKDSEEAPVVETQETVSQEPTESTDLGSATPNQVEESEAVSSESTVGAPEGDLPEQQEKSLTSQPSLYREDQNFDPLVKSEAELFFGEWCKSLEIQGKKISGKVLTFLDRDGWESLFVTVKKGSKFSKSPVANSKSKKVNRQLKKGFIDLSLIPYAVKTIETKEGTADYHLCGGQELLNMFGNYYYEAVSKAKAKRVDTDKDGQSHPAKYFEGLDQETRKKRERVIEERMKEGVKPPKLYEDLPGDDEAETEPSKYSKTKVAEDIREEIKKPGKEEFIRAASKVSGVKPSIIEQVYDRGMKAWSTSGHRPGAGPEQWAIARVYSFLSGGTTQKTADKDLWKEHLESK